MKKQILISDIQQKINLYFDKALNKEDEIELISKVKSNPKIQELFNKEKVFREKIKDCYSRTTASSKLINAVRNQLDAK